MSGGVSATTAIEVGVAVAGAAASAYGAMQQAHAQSESGKYNAAVAQNNSTIAKQNADYAGATGEEQAAVQDQKNRAKIGALIANQGASGVDINSPSSIDVQQSAAETGQLDTMTIRADAARKAYGYELQASNNQAQAGLDTMQAKNAQEAGDISAVGGVLGAASKSSAFTDWASGNSLNSEPDSFANASDDEVDNFIAATR